MNSHKFTTRDGAECEVWETGTVRLGRETTTVPFDLAFEMIRLSRLVDAAAEDDHRFAESMAAIAEIEGDTSPTPKHTQ